DTNQVLEELEVETDSGVRVRLAIEPAHGMVGYGFYFELRTYDVFVTRVLEESPAARAGIHAGDQLLAIEGRKVREMTADQVRSALNTPRMGPLRLTVRHQDGVEVSIKLAEGAIYPLFRETGQAR
ncbi:MAG: PDZ domain-containing protein, partial [Polyangiaceae bacterium]|nr:PDZ domain-containing protein [Polyangiaceae bacterium]